VECDVAYQGRDATQQQVGSLEAKIEREKAQKLDAENASVGLAADLSREKVKVLTLDRELDEARKNHEVEVNKHDILRAAIGVVCDDLEVAHTEGASSLVARVIDITARSGTLERDAFHADINRSFVIARSHYGETISLEVMSLRYAPNYDEKELEELEEVVVPLSRDLAGRIQYVVLSRRG
jgi:hypothetical protein